MVSSNTNQYPENIGVKALEIYFPSRCVDQVELEKYDGVSTGKYTVGLGLTKMAFCDDREDINSICLTAVQNLMEKYDISYSDIGRLEVGTETIIDKSKSVKSCLMQLFAESGNYSVEGVDTTNACYGGTNALFNAINWVESSSWDGRLAIVVTGDIAVYATGAARPTGGAGCVAMLIGPDAPLAIERGLRGTHMEHVYDFYKPNLSSEFPEVDGKLTIECYLKSVDMCYKKYLERLENLHGIKHASLEDLDYFVFHAPFSKQVVKAYGRLAYNDFLRNPTAEKYAAFKPFESMSLKDSYNDRNLMNVCVSQTKQMMNKRVEPSLLAAKQLGNMYCGSVYGGLISLISEVEPEDLMNKRIGVFSYGSGLASTVFSFRVVDSTAEMQRKLNLRDRLHARTVVPPEEFEKTMGLREETHQNKDYTPTGNVDVIFPGTFYLDRVDDKFRRSYARRTVAGKGLRNVDSLHNNVHVSL